MLELWPLAGAGEARRQKAAENRRTCGGIVPHGWGWRGAAAIKLESMCWNCVPWLGLVGHGGRKSCGEHVVHCGPWLGLVRHGCNKVAESMRWDTGPMAGAGEARRQTKLRRACGGIVALAGAGEARRQKSYGEHVME